MQGLGKSAYQGSPAFRDAKCAHAERFSGFLHLSAPAEASLLASKAAHGGFIV